MNVLITGGAGFIGSSVADKLLELGHFVLSIDNYATGQKGNNSEHPNLKIVECSIAEEEIVKDLFVSFKPEIVLHAAASYKDPYDWESDITTNITGTVNIIKHARLNQVKRLVYLQTSLCYGLKPAKTPITPGQPLYSGGYSGGSSYAISKTTAELYIELSGIDFVSLRLANVYGPRNLSGPLPTFYQRLSHDHDCTLVNTRRDFIFIDDVVSVIVSAILGMGSRKYYHVSTGTDHSIRELFKLAVQYLGRASSSKIIEETMGEDDVNTILLDPALTQKDFKWKAKVPFESGVSKTMEWYRTHPVFTTNTHLKNFKQ